MRAVPDRALRAARDKKLAAGTGTLTTRPEPKAELVKIIKNQRGLNIDLVKTIVLTLMGPIVWRLLQKDEWPSTLLVVVGISAYLYFMNPLGSLREKLREFKNRFL